MIHVLRRTAERRNNMVRWSISPTENSAKLASFRLIIPLYEKLTTYLATFSTFATPGPTRCEEPWRYRVTAGEGVAQVRAEHTP
jgi:hypothetical protein